MEIPIDKLGDALKQYVKSIEFAKVDALTKTALLCRNAARKSLDENFTLRNKYSQMSVTIKSATMDKPESEVYVRDKYLADQELGSTREEKEGGVPVPDQIYEAAGIGQNKVIPKQWRAKRLRDQKKAIKKNKAFVQTMKNTLGVWVREGKARFPVILLYTLVTGPRKLKKRPWYRDIVNSTYWSNIDPEFNAAVDRALERYFNRLMK